MYFKCAAKILISRHLLPTGNKIITGQLQKKSLLAECRDCVAVSGDWRRLRLYFFLLYQISRTAVATVKNS